MIKKTALIAVLMAASGAASADAELDRKLKQGPPERPQVENNRHILVAPTGPDSVLIDGRNGNIRGRIHVDTRTGNGSVSGSWSTDF